MFARKKKPVYFGNVRVARRSGPKRTLDQLIDSEDYDSSIIEKIQSAVDLPFEREATGSYLAIDFDVTGYTRGSMISLWGTELNLIGFLYRPKVALALRLRDGSSGKTMYHTKVVKRMSFLAYLLGSLSLRSMFSWSQRDETTFNRLIHECLLENLARTREYLRK